MTLPSGLPDHVANEEVVARHVFNRQHIASDARDSAKKWAKPQAFLPQPSDEGWLFSVTRTLLLANEGAIQRNGLAVGRISNRGLKGSALLCALDIRETSMKDDEGGAVRNLDVQANEASDGSTPYHAHVLGFLPLPAGANAKEYFKEASEELARRTKERSFIKRTLPEEPWEIGE